MTGVFEVIRERVELADVARRFTSLECVNGRLRGRCPLPDHDDSTPSFYVYSDGRAHCYGCRFHGDVVDLWAAVRGLQPGIDAALDLAREYGVRLPDRDPEAQKKADERRRKEDGFAWEAEVFHQNLARHPRVAEWWKGRGFSDELQRRFLLGSNAGGAAAAFPFWRFGRVQGLVERRLKGEPKYCLSRAEEFPDGHKPLFILKGATDFYLVVEGFIDALACNALGFSVVAVGGTGISEWQKAGLLRLKGALFILPDADEEGDKAARAWAQELYPRARVCPAEYGAGRKDVADLFAAEGERAKAILEGLRSRAEDALDLALSETPEGSTRERWRYANACVLPLLLRLADRGERNAAADDAAKALGLKAGDLRAALKSEAPADGKQADAPAKLELLDPEPWPEPVDGAQLLDEIAGTIRRFASLPDGGAEAAALLSLHAHAHDAFEVSPLLAITSPEKRCGKTTVLMLVSKFVPRPLPVANITSAALFRAVETYRPTLLIDEADSFLAGNEELRGIINSGHRRAMACVVRTVGDDHEPRLFSTWCPKAVALIGALPDTLEDRAVLIRMQRRRAGEGAEELRLDRLGALEPLRRRAARWAADNIDRLKTADPDLPPNMTNARARDNWRVLVAVADAAGGRWPALAREVALRLSSSEPDTESIKVLLLRDLKALFDEKGVERLESEKVVTALIEIEGRPWAEGKNGRPSVRRASQGCSGRSVSSLESGETAASARFGDTFGATLRKCLPATWIPKRHKRHTLRSQQLTGNLKRHRRGSLWRLVLALSLKGTTVWRLWRLRTERTGEVVITRLVLTKICPMPSSRRILTRPLSSA